MNPLDNGDGLLNEWLRWWEQSEEAPSKMPGGLHVRTAVYFSRKRYSIPVDVQTLKFQLGDKVRVKEGLKVLGDIATGKTGTVATVRLDYFPYGLIFDDGDIPMWFNEEELEKIEEEE